MKTTTTVRAADLVAGDVILLGPKKGFRGPVERSRSVVRSVSRGRGNPSWLFPDGHYLAIDIGDPIDGPLVVPTDHTVEVVR